MVRNSCLMLCCLVVTACVNISFSQPRNYALVIGIAGYPKFGERDPLRYADSDARLFYDFISTDKGGRFSPDNVKILLNENATRTHILEAIRWIGQRAESEDLVYIFFSGHGVVDDKGLAYFMPYDADFQKPGIEGLRTNHFIEELQLEINSKQLVLFVDACHSGAAYSLDGIAKDRVNNITYNFNQVWREAYAKQKDVRMAILSASSNQRSYEDRNLKHGIFTWYLIQGMNGAADSAGIGDRNGVVTAGELYRYVLDKVEYHAKHMLNGLEQSPTKSPEFAPSFPLALVGNLREASDEKSQDLRSLGQKLVKKSEQALNHFSRGVDFIEKGSEDEAQIEFLKTLEIDSTFEAAYVNLGYIQQGRSNIEGAVRYYQKALTLDPNEYMAHNNLGASCLLLLDFEESTSHLTKSYTRFPTLLTALNLGDAYRYYGYFDIALKWNQAALLALQTLEGYLKEDYASGTWRYNYFPLYRGDNETIKQFVQVKTLDEKMTFIYFGLSFDYALKKIFDRADEEFKKASQLLKDDKLRFFFTNRMQAIRKLIKLDETVDSWFQEHMKELIVG